MDIKATYVRKVIEMFARGRYSTSTEAHVARWLTNGKDDDAKDKALEELWNESLAEPRDDNAAEESYTRWKNRGYNHVKHQNRYLRLWQAVAACLMLAVGVLGTTMLTRRSERAAMTQAYCAPGDTACVALPDGTEVLLNGSTTIVYPERFDGSERQVILLGEATFKVAKDADHPFIVNGNGVSVTALGTEFNVKAYPRSEHVESTLLEGKVRVNYNGGEVVLNPAEQLRYNRTTGIATVVRPSVDDVTAWQRGEIVFNNMTLSEILRELEMRFSHDFVYRSAALPDDRYTFRFRKGMTLTEVMDIVADVAGNLQVSIDDSICRVKPL